MEHARNVCLLPLQKKKINTYNVGRLFKHVNVDKKRIHINNFCLRRKDYRTYIYFNCTVQNRFDVDMLAKRRHILILNKQII